MNHLAVAAAILAPILPLSADIILGANTGLAHVRVIDSNGIGAISGVDGSPQTAAIVSNFFAFSLDYSGGVNVAQGDVNSDGIDDIIVGARTGLAQVRVINGANARIEGISGELESDNPALIDDFFAFDTGYTGGVFVAAGDVNGDGVADTIATASQSGVSSGGSLIRLLEGSDPSTEIASFEPFGSGYFGELNVAFGNVDSSTAGDDIIVGPGPGSSAQIKVFDGAGSELGSFFAYDTNFIGGVTVATGDVNADGNDDIIVGGSIGLSNVRVIDGTKLDMVDESSGVIESEAILADFFAFNLSYSGGINVASGDVNGDGFADVITGTRNGIAQVRVIDGTALTTFTGTPPSDAILDDFFAYNPLFEGGVQIALTPTPPILRQPGAFSYRLIRPIDEEPFTQITIPTSANNVFFPQTSHDLRRWSAEEIVVGDGDDTEFDLSHAISPIFFRVVERPRQLDR